MPSSSDGAARPFVPPSTEPPPPPPTPDEVALVAKAVAMYFHAGCVALLKTHGDELGKVVPIEKLAESLPAASGFVRGSAERVCIKYGIRGIPYQDEIVCVGAIGVATFGFFGKPKKPADAQQQAKNANAQRVPNVPSDAKNANVTPNANANANGHDPTKPLGGDGGDFRL